MSPCVFTDYFEGFPQREAAAQHHQNSISKECLGSQKHQKESLSLSLKYGSSK